MPETMPTASARNRQASLLLKLGLALATIIGLVFAAGWAQAQITGEIGEEVDVGPRLPDMSFFAAEDVSLRVNSTDDVFAAGATVKVEGTGADHLVVAGGEVSLRDVAIEDLLAAGGEFDLVSGKVADDIVVAGGEVAIAPNFTIGSSAVVSGGEVRIETAVPGDLRAAAETVYLNSTVGGDARLSGENVTLGPKARIGGDLFYRTGNLVVEPGAVITGERKVLPPNEQSALESWGRGAGTLFGMFVLAALAGFTLLVLAVAVAVPSLMRSSARHIATRPLQSLGLGLVIAVAAPVAIVMLFASVVGVPLALLIVAICLAMTPVAIAASAFFIGMQLRQRIARAAEAPTGVGARLACAALGAAAIVLAGTIPILGLLVWLLALLAGLGAIASRGGRALALEA